jgi:L-ascorbate metabolism protein UlaG (beta-lactamase superfamily)
VVVDLEGARIVTDPVLRRRVMHLRREADVPAPEDVDAVLISHLHYDHLDLPSLARFGVETRIVVPRGGGKTLRGFENVLEVEPGMQFEVGGLEIAVCEARHDGRRRPFGSPIPAVGYVFDGPRSVYFAGDTDLFDGMRDLAPVDVALLPIWGWGPTAGRGHLDSDRAAEALKLLAERGRRSTGPTTSWGAGRARPGGRACWRSAVAAPRSTSRVLPVEAYLEFDHPAITITRVR